MKEFAGQVALVTGAGRNIGRAIALAFAEAGGDVAIIVNTSRDEAEEVAQEVRARGVRATVAMGNIGDAAQCRDMVSRIVGELGPVTHLVNNAARRPGQSFLEISVEDWDAVLASNLSSVFYLCREVLPAMVEARFGRIINIGGPDGAHGVSHRAHNVACKAGLVGLTKAIALEFGQHGITANLVVPGIMNTSRDPRDYPQWQGLLSSLDRMREESAIAIPRAGECVEIADAVMYLASSRASYVTMQQIYVAGGLMGLP